MSENKTDKPYEILSEGESSRAETIEEWDKIVGSGNIEQIKEFNRDQGFSVWKDESGKFFKVNFRAQSESGSITSSEPKQTFANIVSLSKDEIKDILG